MIDGFGSPDELWCAVGGFSMESLEARDGGRARYTDVRARRPDEARGCTTTGTRRKVDTGPRRKVDKCQGAALGHGILEVEPHPKPLVARRKPPRVAHRHGPAQRDGVDCSTRGSARIISGRSWRGREEPRCRVGGRLSHGWKRGRGLCKGRGSLPPTSFFRHLLQTRTRCAPCVSAPG